MDKNQLKSSNQIPFKIEKGKNYYLLNLDYFFKDYSQEEIAILKKIISIQKIDPFQLKDLIECEGILKNNPLNFKF